MNCTRIQRDLSAMADGALRPRRATQVEAHMANCPACREFSQELGTLAQLVRTRPAPAGPTPEAAWADVRRALRLQGDRPGRPSPFGWLTRPLPWVGALATACVLIAIGALWLRVGHVPPETKPPPIVAATAATTQVLSVSTELADASTMVYEDAESGWTVIWVFPAEEKSDAHS